LRTPGISVVKKSMLLGIKFEARIWIHEPGLQEPYSNKGTFVLEHTLK
jgi:hypothetical protein